MARAMTIRRDVIEFATCRSGLIGGASGAESVVNSLVNARMNKRQQMRWSPRGAHRVLQVRAAVIDGRLSAGQRKVAA